MQWETKHQCLVSALICWSFDTKFTFYFVKFVYNVFMDAMGKLAFQDR